MVGDLPDALQEYFLAIFQHDVLKVFLIEFLHGIKGEEIEGVPERIGQMLDLQQAVPRVPDGQKQMFAEDGGHLSHVVSAHLVLPDSEVLAELVLFEEVNALEGVIPLLVDQPLLLRQELRLLVVVERDALAADGHVLQWVALRVGDDLVVVGMAGPVEVEEVFQHFREIFVELEDVMRLEIGPQPVLALLQDGLRLFRQLLLDHLLRLLPNDLCWQRIEEQFARLEHGKRLAVLRSEGLVRLLGLEHWSQRCCVLL